MPKSRLSDLHPRRDRLRFTLSMDLAGVDLLTVRDGRIVEVHLFSADGDVEDEFWGRP